MLSFLFINKLYTIEAFLTPILLYYPPLDEEMLGIESGDKTAFGYKPEEVPMKEDLKVIDLIAIMIFKEMLRL